jgi:hypothetical protein
VLAALLTGLSLYLIVLLATFEPPPDAEGPSLGLGLIVAAAMAACLAIEALLAWSALVSAMRRRVLWFPLLIAVAVLHVVPNVLLRFDLAWLAVLWVSPLPLALATAGVLRPFRRGRSPVWRSGAVRGDRGNGTAPRR